MIEPVQYPSETPRYALPLLFAGQTQKEFFVNAALSLCDTLLHPVVEGEASSPPAEPADGEGWLVGADADGEFAGRSGELAFRQQGQWLFISPKDGMRVLDRSSGQAILRHGNWRRVDPVMAPNGGAVIDAEARQALDALIAALVTVGILPQI
jgi:hypothetical protein